MINNTQHNLKIISLTNYMSKGLKIIVKNDTIENIKIKKSS